MEAAPRFFDQDPQRNIQQFSRFFDELPWDKLNAIRPQLVEEDPSRESWTDADLLRHILLVGLRKEKALLSHRERLEKLLNQSL